LVLNALLLAACASEPVQPGAETHAAEAPKPQAKVCDDEPVTGSRIKRCDRSGVQVMTREDLERATSRSGPLPMDGAPGR
jgi:hypothetical protein